MKEKDIYDDEEIDKGQPTHINDLLEPLVEEKKLNISPLKKDKKYLYKSVNPNTFSNDYANEFNKKNPLLHNSVNVNYLNNKANNPINRIRREMEEIKKDKDNETEISNFSNAQETETLKIENFIFIIIVTIFSSLQFGIYLYIFNLYMNAMNSPHNNFIGGNLTAISNKGLLYSFFLVLCWKYQIYFIIYLIYAVFIYFKLKKGSKNEENKNYNEDSAPLINRTNSITSQDSFIASFGNNPTFKFREFKYKYLQKFGSSYESYYHIFILTSNIFNVQENENDKNFEYYININEIIKGILGILFAYLILASSYFYYFGIIYLIQEITSLLPYYIEYNNILNSNNNDNNTNNNENKSITRNLTKKLLKGGNNGEFYKYIFPVLISFGLYFLQKTITNSSLILIIILILCIAVQISSQKKFIISAHEESPFQILFRTYLNYTIISLILCFIFEAIFNGFNIKNIFYWLTNLKLFFSCLIGFGICGAICYNMLIIFMRISLSNNIIVKLIKYFNLIIIDIIGVFIFRQYIIMSYIDYIIGLSLCGVSMLLLDFHKIL